MKKIKLLFLALFLILAASSCKKETVKGYYNYDIISYYGSLDGLELVEDYVSEKNVIVSLKEFSGQSETDINAQAIVLFDEYEKKIEKVILETMTDEEITFIYAVSKINENDVFVVKQKTVKLNQD